MVAAVVVMNLICFNPVGLSSRSVDCLFKRVCLVNRVSVYISDSYSSALIRVFLPSTPVHFYHPGIQMFLDPQEGKFVRLQSNHGIDTLTRKDLEEKL